MFAAMVFILLYPNTQAIGKRAKSLIRQEKKNKTSWTPIFSSADYDWKLVNTDLRTVSDLQILDQTIGINVYVTVARLNLNARTYWICLDTSGTVRYIVVYWQLIQMWTKLFRLLSSETNYTRLTSLFIYSCHNFPEWTKTWVRHGLLPTFFHKVCGEGIGWIIIIMMQIR